MRYFFELSYKGSRYHGWQKQRNALSVQEVIEQALSTLFKNPVEILGCGRTDTGVHAFRYMAQFETEETIPEDFIYRINAILPEDVAVYRFFPVSQEMNARFEAVSRTYKYFIHTRKEPFLADRSYFFRFRQKPDIEAMNFFCAQLLEIKDFSSFEKKGSDNENSLCTLTRAKWEWSESEMVFEITANRFLRNMVRAIVGTCLMIGTGKANADDVLQKVKNRETVALLMTAPAHGLHLWKIVYPEFSTES